MTGYTVHTGSSKRFSQGWDRIFTTKQAKAKSDRGRRKKTASSTTSKKKSPRRKKAK